MGKALRSRPDPAAVVALVAAAAAAARSRLGAAPDGASPPHAILAVIERPAPGFNNGRLSWLATGFAYGVWRAALAAAGVPVLSVPAAAWKKDLGLLRQGKDASRDLAGAWLSEEAAGPSPSSSSSSGEEEEEEAQGSSLTARGGLLGRKRDHGRAEAALIALWGAAIGRGGAGGRVECEGVASGPVETATPGPPGRRKAVAAAPASTTAAAPTLMGGSGRRAAVAAAGAAAASAHAPAAAAPSGRRAASTQAATKKTPPRGPGASAGEGEE